MIAVKKKIKMTGVKFELPGINREKIFLKILNKMPVELTFFIFHEQSVKCECDS